MPHVFADDHAEHMQKLLAEHVARGDPVDVANLPMMAWNREARNSPSNTDPTETRLECDVSYPAGTMRNGFMVLVQTLDMFHKRSEPEAPTTCCEDRSSKSLSCRQAVA